MKILSIIAQKPKSTGSGVYLTELVRALDELGQEQAVIAGVYKEDQVLLPNNVQFFPVYYQTAQLPFPIAGMSDQMPYESTCYRCMTPKMVEQFRKAFLMQVYAAVQAFNPDLIICHHLYLLTAFVRDALQGKKIFGICHGTDLRQMRTNPLKQEYIRRQIQNLDRIFCLHQYQEKEVQLVFGIPTEKTVVSGNGYNPIIFHRLEGIQPHTGYHLSFAGKISEKKGVFSLIRSLHFLPYPRNTLRVSLAGGYRNSDYQVVTELIRRCPYPVTLCGNLAQDQLARLFNESDLFVLPSFYDGLPLVLTEALACGAKVICTDLPGIRPWLDQHIPDHGIYFLPPPIMMDTDTPEPSDLPAFEHTLAETIQTALKDTTRHHPQLQQVSWKGVGQTLLHAAKDVGLLE